MSMVGADHERLLAAAQEMRRAADELERSQSTIHRVLIGVAWLGQVAVDFTGMWNGHHRRSLMSTSGFIRDAAVRLEQQAYQQRDASAAGVVGSAWQCTLPPLGDLESRRVAPFVSSASGREAIVEAFYATGDARRAEGHEIEIRKLDNGRYVVVLPGVVDLSDEKGEAFRGFWRGDVTGSWFDGEQPNTVRRMEYAITESMDSSDTFANPYAVKVAEQMERAGIPPGADVMLIGHSFGAYTAMELAGDPRFNSASCVDDSGFHVNVTHVVAAGADTNWKMAELPPATKSLIFNNRYDVPFLAEDAIQPDLRPQNSGQLEIEFFGGLKGMGHGPDNYATWLSSANDRPALNEWLDDAGRLYSAGGTAYSVSVREHETASGG